MKKNLKLIATLPAISNMQKVKSFFENPFVSEVRFNTASPTPYSCHEVIDMLKYMSQKYGKPLWVDIKGRQLKVTKWADPMYSSIHINHKIDITYPAKVYFRNGDRVNITHIKDGNNIFVDPLPKEALGAGQSINIICDEIKFKDGYLTDIDKQYLNACQINNHYNIMASFVESFDDIYEIQSILKGAIILSKIESMNGIKFISNNSIKNLVAARDDLYLQSGENSDMLKHMKTIISKDKKAICASRIFLSLEKRENVDFADFADIELMYKLGYRSFMLCDNICNYKFEKAIKAWEDFVNG